MLCLDECKAKLVSFKQCFGHEFGIKSIGIFGSVARQENREDSDLDIVVDIDNPTLSTMYTLKTVLTEMFHCEIDLVRFRSSLPPFLKQNIEKESIYYIQQWSKEINCADDFLASMDKVMVFNACVMRLQVIGEQVGKLLFLQPSPLSEYKEIPWLAIYDMRNLISHEYSNVDEQIVFTTIKNDLIELDKVITVLLNKYL